jgi:glycerol uptake facilitator-like aquaporin
MASRLYVNKSSSVLGTAAAACRCLLSAVCCLLSAAGGHLNPAVTVSMLAARRVSPVRALLYIISQMAGAIVDSALVLAVDPQGHKAALGASNRLNDWVRGSG